MPTVFASGITVNSVDEARRRITESTLFPEDEREKAVRIIKSLISQKHIAKAQDSEAESRIDYFTDMLGLHKSEVVSAVRRMRQERILADTKDMTAYLYDIGSTQRKSQQILENYVTLERYIIEQLLKEESLNVSYKQLNDNAVRNGIETSTEKSIRTLLNFLKIRDYIEKKKMAHET